METYEGAECPFCLEQMQIEERDGSAWLVCVNGCPTESEVVIRKPPAPEAASGVPAPRARTAGSST